MFTLFPLLHAPTQLYTFTLLCFVFGLLLLEGMKYAEKKGCRASYITFSILSIIMGICGWVFFFITLNQYVTAGLHP